MDKELMAWARRVVATNEWSNHVEILKEHPLVCIVGKTGGGYDAINFSDTEGNHYEIIDGKTYQRLDNPLRTVIEIQKLTPNMIHDKQIREDIFGATIKAKAIISFAKDKQCINL